MRIERISSLDLLGKAELLYETYRFLHDLNREYPAFRSWYLGKVVVGVFGKSREVLYCREQGRLVAVSILKNHPKEKKICTLRVHDNFKRMGLGSALLRESCEVLNCQKPLITVSESKIAEFKDFLSMNGFNLVETCSDYYVQGSKEYCFNGQLESQSASLSHKLCRDEKCELSYA